MSNRFSRAFVADCGRLAVVGRAICSSPVVAFCCFCPQSTKHYPLILHNVCVMPSSSLSRREFVRRSAMLGAVLSLSGSKLLGASSNPSLQTFAYDDVSLTSDLHRNQLLNTHAVLMGLDEDGLMLPFRVMSGLP